MRSEYNAVFVPLGGGESAVAMWMTSVTTMSNDDYTSNRRGNSEREIQKKRSAHRNAYSCRQILISFKERPL